MSQHDYDLANQSGAAFRGDLNNVLGAIASLNSGASAPTTTFAYMLWADTTTGLLKQRNAANSAWIVRKTLAETFVLSRSSNTILGVGDFSRAFVATAAFTQTLTAAATLGDGWFCEYRNASAGYLTIDPNSSETIDGASTLTLFPGESCLIYCNGSAFFTFGRPPGAIRFPNRHIQGLVPANNAGDATNDLDFSAGECRDATNAVNIVTAALTKQSDVAWAVGSAAGMLDTGVVGNNDYFVWAILRSDTGVTDLLCSLSSTAPTMPANYDYKRLVAWFKRSGGAIVAFKAYETEGGGLDWLWSSPTLDINLANTLTTSRRTDAVKVPLAFSTIAQLNVQLAESAAGYDAIIYCPDQSDLVPSNSVAPLNNIRNPVAAGSSMQIMVRTSSAGLIAARATLATIDSYLVSTIGFRWDRRN